MTQQNNQITDQDLQMLLVQANKRLEKETTFTAKTYTAAS